MTAPLDLAALRGLVERPWTAYTSQRPAAEGIYEWRMPSLACPGLVVRVYAEHRKRGAGYADTVSPSFDHWDGYRVHVPAGLEWRAADENAPQKLTGIQVICAEGVEFAPCPYCKKTPTLNALDWNSGGVAVLPSPTRLNKWWLTCCAWASSPRMSDPRHLAEQRSALLDELEGLRGDAKRLHEVVAAFVSASNAEEWNERVDMFAEALVSARAALQSHPQPEGGADA